MSIERFSSGGPWEQTYGYSRVVHAGNMLLTAGCTSTLDGEIAHVGEPYAQALQAFAIALDALADAGASIEDVVRTRMYVTGREHADAVGRAHGALFGAVRPVATLVVVAGLLHPDHLVEVEVEAYAAGAHAPAATTAVPPVRSAAPVVRATSAPPPAPGPVPRHHDLFSPHSGQ
jgi:enamine deaminase RidA (YjgF/YER057c/UK114 family)